MDDRARRFSPWFYAAAIYNTLWGAWTVLWPNHLFELLKIKQPIYLGLQQAVGMMVMVYAIGYVLLAREPIRYCGLIWIALFGKIFGVVGFVWTYQRGELPLSFLWVNFFNDIIWLPAFLWFAWKHARHPLGSEWRHPPGG